MTISIKTILISTFLLIGLIASGLMGQTVLTAYSDYRRFSDVSERAQLDEGLVKTLLGFRNERGDSVSALKLDPSVNSATLASLAKNRGITEAAMASVKSAAAGLTEGELGGKLSDMFSAYNRFVSVRSEVDAEVSKPLAGRNPALQQSVMDVGQQFISALETASNTAEADIRALDPEQTPLTQIRAMAWSTRATGGVATLTINSVMADGRKFTPEETSQIATSFATMRFAWQATENLVQHDGTPASIRTAFNEAQSDYFGGDFAALQAKTLDAMAKGEPAPMKLDDWRPLVTGKLKLIANVASEAVSNLSASASARQQAAFTTSIICSVLFIAILTICIITISVILFRVTGPVAALTRCMTALAQGDKQINIPGVARRDEVGEMARAVEVFRQAAIHNEELERQAEQNRLRSEQDRIETQRRAEMDAEERLSQATDALATGLKRLAGGDLLCEIHEAFTPQFEALRHDFNTSVVQLRDALTGVGRAARLVRDGSSEISQASDNLSRRTEQQAASLEETAAALEQVTANVQSTSKRASEARDLVRGARTHADTSSTVVSNAVTAMGKIEHASKQISQIIGVIDEIAFQTNLLALNAGVEAARAGDAGKGFAVVAQEVRELAQRSANAAKEIKGLIGNSEVAVSEGVRLVRDTGEGLSAIADVVQSINQHMDAIATAAQEQASGLNEINTAVNHMDQATQQNAAMVEEMNAAGSGLASESARLGDLMSGFRIGGDATTAAAPQPRRAPATAPVAVTRATPRMAAASHGNAALNKLTQEWSEF